MTDLPDNPVHAGDGAEIIARLRYRASTAHMAFYTNLAEHAALDRQAADLIQSLLAQMQKVEGENERLRKERVEWKEIADLGAWADGLHDPSHPYVNTILARAETAEATIATLQKQLETARGAMRRIMPYLTFTIGEESPGHHPTMPSAVAAFKEALSAINTQEGKDG